MHTNRLRVKVRGAATGTMTWADNFEMKNEIFRSLSNSPKIGGVLFIVFIIEVG